MLEIDVPLVAMTAIVFLALIAILNPLLYKPLLKFMDDRDLCIKNDEENTSKNTSDLSVYEKEIESITSNAKAQAHKIIQDAITAAKEAAVKEVEAKRATLEAEYSGFLATLDDKRAELKANLILRLPEFKTALNSKLAKI